MAKWLCDAVMMILSDVVSDAAPDQPLTFGGGDGERKDERRPGPRSRSDARARGQRRRRGMSGVKERRDISQGGCCEPSLPRRRRRERGQVRSRVR